MPKAPADLATAIRRIFDALMKNLQSAAALEESRTEGRPLWRLLPAREDAASIEVVLVNEYLVEMTLAGKSTFELSYGADQRDALIETIASIVKATVDGNYEEMTWRRRGKPVGTGAVVRRGERELQTIGRPISLFGRIDEERRAYAPYRRSAG